MHFATTKIVPECMASHPRRRKYTVNCFPNLMLGVQSLQIFQVFPYFRIEVIRNWNLKQRQTESLQRRQSRFVTNTLL